MKNLEDKLNELDNNTLKNVFGSSTSQKNIIKLEDVNNKH